MKFSPIAKYQLFGFIFFCFIVQNLFVYLDHPTSIREYLNSNEMAGLQVWRKNGCVFCHQFYGQGGFLGPDLTNVTTRVEYEDFSARLDSGGYRMPSFKISTKEKRELFDYLKFMSQTGQGTLNLPKNGSDIPWYEFKEARVK